MNFKHPSTETLTSTPHDLYHPEADVNVNLLEDGIDGEHKIGGEHNVDISELTDVLGLEASCLETCKRYSDTRPGTIFEGVRGGSTVLKGNRTY